jgi:hypothetical protein
VASAQRRGVGDGLTVVVALLFVQHDYLSLIIDT